MVNKKTFLDSDDIKAIAKAITIESENLKKSRHQEPKLEEVTKVREEFIQEGTAGILNGKPWTGTYPEGVRTYFKKYLKNLPSHCQHPLTIDTFRMVLAKEKEYSNKKWLYDVYRSLSLFFVLKKRIPASRREEAKRFKPKRVGLPSKKFIHKHERTLLIKGVWKP